MIPRILLAAFLLACTAPTAAADWVYNDTTAYVGDSTCRWDYTFADPSCTLAYTCTGGSPPQVVDTALHCAGRATRESEDVIVSAPTYGWQLLDFYTVRAEDQVALAHDEAQPTVDEVNGPLCAFVWSLFCTAPLVLPQEMPVADPVNGYPL